MRESNQIPIFFVFFFLWVYKEDKKTFWIHNISNMNRRWLCSDVWMDILPSFDHAQLGLKMALLSDRFDVLVDAHFDAKSELTIWNWIIISKDKGPNTNENGPKPKVSIRIDNSENFVDFTSVPIDANFVDFPLSDRQLPNKICFKSVRIEYIDHSVITFLNSKKRFFDRNGTKLELYVSPSQDNDDQPIWDVFVTEIWPIFAKSIRHLGFTSGAYLDNLRRRTSPTILTDLCQLNSIDSGALFPDGIADFEAPNGNAGQALTKWLHTPTTDGQPKQLHRNDFVGPPNLEWVNNFKETFRRATTSVSYHIQLYFRVDTMPTEQFELVNEVTKEKLTLKQKIEAFNDEIIYNWLLQRCPIGETAKAALNWEDSENWSANANTNNISFDLWSFDKCIGPLSPPAEEENEEEEADQSNGNE